MDEQLLKYTDGDLIVFDQVSDFFQSAPETGRWAIQKQFSSLNMVVLLLCYQGTVQLRLNGWDYKTSAGEGLALLPSAVIDRLMVSSDIHMRGFGFAVTAMESIFHTYRQTWEEALSLNDNPHVQLSEEQMQMAEHLYQIALLERPMTDSRHYRPMIRSLAQSLLYMLADIISRRPVDAERTSTAKEQQFKRFVQLLWASGGKEREVAYFADQMCITPKYLSVIVRDSCGKTPMQMIHSYTSNMIAQMLRNTDLSIKEIAHELNFNNESFFGRYVKRHLGCPPGQYRMKMKKNDN